MSHSHISPAYVSPYATVKSRGRIYSIKPIDSRRPLRRCGYCLSMSSVQPLVTSPINPMSGKFHPGFSQGFGNSSSDSITEHPESFISNVMVTPVAALSILICLQSWMTNVLTAAVLSIRIETCIIERVVVMTKVVVK